MDSVLYATEIYLGRKICEQWAESVCTASLMYNQSVIILMVRDSGSLRSKSIEIFLMWIVHEMRVKLSRNLLPGVTSMEH